MENPPPHFQSRYTLGHEGCGEVVEIGQSTEPSLFKIGDMVAILSVPGCGETSCPDCSRGYTQLCLSCPRYGAGCDGAFAPYIAVSSRAAVRVPKGVPPPLAAVTTDAVLTPYHAIHQVAHVKKGETVILYGLGGLGFNALQILLALGTRPFAVDIREDVLDEAVKFGLPRENIVTPTQSASHFVSSKNILVDTAFDFVGLPATFRSAQQTVRKAGKIVLVGTISPELPIVNDLAIRKKLSILCSYAGTRGDLEDCLELVARGVVRPKVMTSDLDQFPDLLAALEDGKVKSRAVMTPH